MMKKKALLGMTPDELRSLAAEMGMPAFTAAQMARWIYKSHVTDIGEMTNISLNMRARLSEQYRIGCIPPADCQRSVDGTVKYMFPTDDGQMVESVFIPDGERATLCVSSQVGCRMGCRFCMTGRQGFQGNLSVKDILNQIFSLPERDQLTNVVFMGQGEPMDNYEAMLKATQILTADYGWAWSPKRITVSTVGVNGKVERFLDQSDCHLAVSLHNPFPEERLKMMPAEKTCSITDLLAMLKRRD